MKPGGSANGAAPSGTDGTSFFQWRTPSATRWRACATCWRRAARRTWSGAHVTGQGSRRSGRCSLESRSVRAGSTGAPSTVLGVVERANRCRATKNPSDFALSPCPAGARCHQRSIDGAWPNLWRRSKPRRAVAIGTTEPSRGGESTSCVSDLTIGRPESSDLLLRGSTPTLRALELPIAGLTLGS